MTGGLRRKEEELEVTGKQVRVAGDLSQPDSSPILLPLHFIKTEIEHNSNEGMKGVTNIDVEW